MAPVFRVRGRGCHRGGGRGEADERYVRWGTGGGTVPTAYAVTAGGHTGVVEADNRGGGGVPRQLGGRNTSDRARRESDHSDHRHGGREELIIYAAGVLFTIRHNDRNRAAGLVTRGFIRAVLIVTGTARSLWG